MAVLCLHAPERRSTICEPAQTVGRQSYARLAIAAVLLGTLLFCINHAGVIAAEISAPAGYRSVHILRNFDQPQYITWMTLARNHFLLPDYHAPWQTAPALFQPMMMVAARLGPSPIISYYALQFLLYWVAAFAFLLAAFSFRLTPAQVFLAALIVICAVPLKLLAWVGAPLIGLPRDMFVEGLIQYSYETADGLFRGGSSNGPTLTFGTAIILFAFTFLARYLETFDRREFCKFLASVFLAGLLHPFEVFLIAAVGGVLLLQQRQLRYFLLVVAAAGCGIAPYVVLTLKTPWLRDISGLIHWSMPSRLWVPAVYGVPVILLIYLMLLRFRMKPPGDRVLQAWFLGCLILPFVPVLPFALHLFNGFACCVAFLLVRRVASDRQLLAVLATYRKTAQGMLAVWVTVSVLATGAVYVQVFRDGRSVEPALLISAIASADETRVLDWVGAHVPSNALVLSPQALSPLVATAPAHSFASHDFSSITYQEQSKLADRFYAGEDLTSYLIGRFGLRYVIVGCESPAARRLERWPLRLDLKTLKIYEVSSDALKPYDQARLRK